MTLAILIALFVVLALIALVLFQLLMLVGRLIITVKDLRYIVDRRRQADEASSAKIVDKINMN